MGQLFLVRHGQASFGSEDYDRLSDLGRRQCVRLGEFFRQAGIVFEVALTGTLRRQVDSLACIAQGMQMAPEAQAWPGLNEYDGDALVAALNPEPIAPLHTPDGARAHFRLLREGLQAWMDGRTRPQGMPSHAEFVAGIRETLDHVRTSHAGAVLIVSSGGPIATAVADVLGAPNPAAIELNMRIRNSAVTEFVFSPKRHSLLSFNTLPHLSDPALEGWVTYS
ncbi:histidine phosphatase family protein [uncultured Piscinibacter sp.]|uniref:histidine phosphatase family protein n=1 Tax=uncultured Piscinibacter sp. TaxID=1131835 RepID=UPI0026313212|nr:histidine phosphatase family protein [uncultured Piscinibacter sp.]